jgi:hypothetical protein
MEVNCLIELAKRELKPEVTKNNFLSMKDFIIFLKKKW